MKFISTRGISAPVGAAQAISQGIAEDGGLFVPAEFPVVTPQELNQMLEMEYAERSAFVLSKYLTDYDYDKLKTACEKAYAQFDGDAAPLVKVDKNKYVLELFHGPTLAFKDIALTLLPFLLREGCDLSGIKEDVLILVATSGDTGKAALEGFKNARGIKIMVFYPDEGVSDMQKLQMCTQEGDNVNVLAVKGNFDDCQSAVKRIFTSEDCKSDLKSKNVVLSSANSINFGRLAPQISYYFSAYCDLVTGGQIEMGDTVNFTVPTGNFGNILAAYYAKRMGLPIGKLVCASNVNKVLTDFLTTGEYSIDREFFKTTSPSMDILISSNLERLIFEFSGRNGELTRSRMLDLVEKGVYQVSKEELSEIQKIFYGNYCSEEHIEDAIYDFFEDYDYVLDTHTAVAVHVAGEYAAEEADDAPMVIVSTASPYKFPTDVLYSITGRKVKDAFVAANMLLQESAMPIPDQLLSLREKPVRFTKSAERENLYEEVLEFVK